MARNTTNTTLTYEGVTKRVSEWAYDFGVAAIVLHSLLRNGVSDAEVIEQLKLRKSKKRANMALLSPTKRFKLPPDNCIYTNYKVFDVERKCWWIAPPP